jgi:hypothetical protein
LSWAAESEVGSCRQRALESVQHRAAARAANTPMVWGVIIAAVAARA